MGAVRLADPPLLRTVGELRLEDPPVLRTVGEVRDVDPPVLRVAGVRVGAAVPPPPGFLTLEEGLVTGILVPEVALPGLAEGDPDVGVRRSSTGRPVVAELPRWGAPVVRDVGVADREAVVPVRRLADPSTPGRACPCPGLAVVDEPRALPVEGTPVRGVALRLAPPSTPCRDTGGVSRTTTCGVPGSPLALSLKPKWATPRLGWT